MDLDKFFQKGELIPAIIQEAGTGEVLMLAVRSLMEVTGEWVLDLSHMGFLCGVLDELGLRGPERAELLRAVGSRSVQSIRAVCAAAGARARRSRAICAFLLATATVAAARLPSLSRRARPSFSRRRAAPGCAEASFVLPYMCMN